METKLLMGNEAMALGAIRAGVGLVAGYPGTPSTEVLETVAKYNDGSIYIEWSVNEKSALEVAAGASYSGQRTLVTMKQVGLNVASDPLMSLAYVGIKGGMVILTADDPGPISSQTEQDTRKFAEFSKLPVFDPSSPEEAYYMMEDAFELSEEHQTPVIFRPTTRICHACASVETDDKRCRVEPSGFVRDSKWVIFPRLAYESHLRIEKRNRALRHTLSSYKYNTVKGSGTKGIAAGGISYAYVCEALAMLGADCKLMKISTPHPFPEDLAVNFMNGLDQVMVFEELDPVIEKELVYICGKHGINVEIRGKLTGDTASAGENTVDSVYQIIAGFLGIDIPEKKECKKDMPPLPVRPPVLCAGCPHRASFYAVKKAMKGRNAYFTGDIGCYTLGNAMPLDMVDTCLCMGAGITIAQGMKRINKDAVYFAFVGDSTYFHTGLAGVANAVYNQADITVVILDNSTTAMTGQQPNPSTGKNAMGEVASSISIEDSLRGLGVKDIYIVDPMDQPRAIQAAVSAANTGGVSAIIFRAPCIAVSKPKPALVIDTEKCTGCKKCIRELGCPAIVKDGKKVTISSSLCYGCGICRDICPFGAITGGENNA